MFPQSEAPMESDVHSRALLSISFGVTCKGHPRPGSPHRATSERERERETSTSTAPFVHLSKSLVNKLPSRFPSGAPMERYALLQSLFYITLRVSSKGAPP